MVYRLLGERALAAEIRDMDALVDKLYPDLRVTQDLGLGMLLWMSHLLPGVRLVASSPGTRPGHP